MVAHNVLLLALVGAMVQAGSPSPAEPAQANPLAALDSEDVNQRCPAYDALSANREETVRRLLEIAEKHLPEAGRYSIVSPGLLAVKLLGQHRAKEAIPFCIEHVTASAGELIVASRSFLTGYPCAKALASIGKPASQAILHRLASKPSTDKEAKLLARVVLDIEGKDVGRFMIKQMMRRRNALQASRLHQVLDAYFADEQAPRSK